MKATRRAVFQPMGEAWPACYVHPQLRLMLVVYVDDFKLAGPKEKLAAGWALLRKNLGIEDDVEVGAGRGHCLSWL